MTSTDDEIAKFLLTFEPELDKLLDLTITPQYRLFYILSLSTVLSNLFLKVLEERNDKDTIEAVKAWMSRSGLLFADPPSSFVDLVVEYYEVLEKGKAAAAQEIDTRMPEVLRLMQRALHALVFTPPKRTVTDAEAANDLRDFAAFVSELRNESDRGAALVGAAVIDSRLQRLLASHLVADAEAQAIVTEDSPSAPLGTFSARIQTCYALGLITAGERNECNIIRGVRNKFSHRLHGLKFSDQSIADRCGNLKALGKGGVTPRQNFIDATLMLCMVLWYRPAHASAYRAQQRVWGWQLNPIPKQAQLAGPKVPE